MLKVKRNFLEKSCRLSNIKRGSIWLFKYQNEFILIRFNWNWKKSGLRFLFGSRYRNERRDWCRKIEFLMVAIEPDSLKTLWILLNPLRKTFYLNNACVPEGKYHAGWANVRKLSGAQSLWIFCDIGNRPTRLYRVTANGRLATCCNQSQRMPGGARGCECIGKKIRLAEAELLIAAISREYKRINCKEPRNIFVFCKQSYI